MKKRFGKRVLSFALLLVFLFSYSVAEACTAVYVGKKVSTDGTVMIARSEDQGNGAYNKMFLVVPRVENQPGRTMDDVNGFSYPLPTTTYKHTIVPDYSEGGDGPYYGACTNEYGVSITGTVTAYANPKAEAADPCTEKGLREAVLPGLVAATSKTAREGVERVGEVIEKYGSAENNIIMIADQKEAWYMEIYNGHQWAAVKMPEDKVAVYGNQFMLEFIDPEDKENVMYSKELFTLPEKKGFAVMEDEKMNLVKTYSEPLEDNANLRTWGGHHFLSPATAKDYKTDRRYPLFYTPAKRVSPLDVMNILRYRYEDTPYNINLPKNKDLRAIGVERQSQIHVIQVNSSYPREISALQWLALGNAEHSVFLPSFSGIEDTHEAYKVDGEIYDPQGAYWKFKRLCTLAEQNRDLYGKGVRDFWSSRETQMLKEMKEAEKKMKELYAKDPKEAKDYVTQLAKDTAQRAFDDSDKMYLALFTYVMDKTGMKESKIKEPFRFLTEEEPTAQER